MTTKSLIILAVWIIAIVLFALEGFDIANSRDYNLVAVGLALTLVGFALEKFWTE